MQGHLATAQREGRPESDLSLEYMHTVCQTQVDASQTVRDTLTVTPDTAERFQCATMATKSVPDQDVSFTTLLESELLQLFGVW